MLISEKKKEIVTKLFLHNDAYDQNEEGDLSHDIDKLNEVIKHCTKTITNCINLHRWAITDEMVDNVLPAFNQLFTSPTIEEATLVSCLMLSCIEYLNDEFFVDQYGNFIEIIKKQPSDVNLWRNAVYGLGVIAKRLDRNRFNEVEAFVKEYLSECLKLAGDTKEDKELKDNCVSCAFYLVVFQLQGEEQTKYAEFVLKNLPIQNDLEEAVSIHFDFFNVILEGGTAFNKLNLAAEVKKIILAIENVNQTVAILDDKGVALLIQIKELI